MVNNGSLSICLYSIAFVLVATQVGLLSLNPDLRLPTLSLLFPRNALVSIFAIRFHSLIETALSSRGATKVSSTIIQRVVVDVVSYLSRFKTQNEAMHSYRFSIGTTTPSIETICVLIPVCAPVPLVKPIKIYSVYDGVLVVSERYKTIRCAARLDNLVSTNTAFRHMSSLKDVCYQPHFSIGVSG